MNYQTSAEGRAFIKQEEGVEYTAYLDIAGVPTIGVGHTRKVSLGQKASEADVDLFLQEDLVEAEQAVNAYVTVPLSQHQVDALVSLVFNIGGGAFRTSTLLDKLNAGDYEGAADQFPRWNKARVKGKLEESKGLTARRNRERKVFLKK